MFLMFSITKSLAYAYIFFICKICVVLRLAFILMLESRAVVGTIVSKGLEDLAKLIFEELDPSLSNYLEH
jgi:hypothetical protein